MKRKIMCVALAGLAIAAFAAPKAKDSKRNAKQAAAQEQTGRFIKRTVAIYRFTNEAKYAKGAFYDSTNDPVSTQAVDSLEAKLAETGKFNLLNRKDQQLVDKEVRPSEIENADRAEADYIIVGSVTSFGRKENGKKVPFKTTKTQTVEVGVSLQLIDVRSSQIVWGGQAEGTAESETTSVMGYGGQAGYDTTLVDKALQAAYSQVVENIVNTCTDKLWESSLAFYDGEYGIIFGDASQDIRSGDSFAIIKRGKMVKNSQTNAMIELPGKQVGTVTVFQVNRDGTSLVTVSGDIPANLSDGELLATYKIQEIAR